MCLFYFFEKLKSDIIFENNNNTFMVTLKIFKKNNFEIL